MTEAELLVKPYTYRASVVKVYDGDTITIDFTLLQETRDVGFGIELHQVMKYKKRSLRLFGLDTPELREPEREMGLMVRDYVRELIFGKDVIIESIKDKTGKYGRYLAITYYYENEQLINLNDHLIELGMAVAKTY